MSVPETCIHCSVPIPSADMVIARFGNKELHFCCHGCRGAYAIITGAGLHSFYEKRKWENPGIPAGAFETRYDEAYLRRIVVQKEGFNEISLLLEGIRCAACVWLIERVLERLDGVLEARVNYSTHAAMVRFDSSKIHPADIFRTIHQLG